GAPFDRSHHVAGRTEGVVDDEGDAVSMGDVGERLEVRDVVLRVADRLDVDRLGVVLDRGFEVGRIVTLDESHLPAEPGECDLELVVRPSVQVGGRHQMVTCLHERGEREQLRRLAGRGGDRGAASLEGGDPLLEAFVRRVHDPGVEVPDLLEAEQTRRVSESSNVYDVVWKIGTARELVPGSGSWPAWTWS